MGLLVLILQLASRDGASNHPQDAVVAQPVPREPTRQPAGNRPAQATLPLGTARCVRIVRGCVRILVCRLLRIGLWVVRVLGIRLLIVSWLRILALARGRGTVTRRRCTAASFVSIGPVPDHGARTSNPHDPEGCWHCRPRIDRLADHAGTLPVAGDHKDSLGPEAHSHRGHCHIADPETDTPVARTVAGRNSEIDRTAGLAADSQERGMNNWEAVGCRDPT